MAIHQIIKQQLNTQKMYKRLLTVQWGSHIVKVDVLSWNPISWKHEERKKSSSQHVMEQQHAEYCWAWKAELPGLGKKGNTLFWGNHKEPSVENNKFPRNDFRNLTIQSVALCCGDG